MMVREATAPPRPRDRVLFRTAVALAVLPLMVSAVATVTTLGNRYHTNSDRALIELRVRDVGHHAVLLGPCCRDRWSHPGPALFYLLAAPYKLTGSRSYGLLLGALVINAAAVVGIAFVARRRGGLPLVLCSLVVIALVMRAQGPNLFRDFWNPYVTLLPFLLVVFLAWSLGCGDFWALPVGVGVASFVVQSQVGDVLVTATPIVWGLAWSVISSGRPPPRASQRKQLVRAGFTAIAVAGVLWFPAVLEQALHRPGNMVEIARFFSRGGRTHSVRTGLHAVFQQLSAFPQWLTGARPGVSPATGELLLRHAPLPLMVLPFTAVVVVLARLRERAALVLAATVALGSVCAVAATRQVVGPVYPYRVRWISMLGAATLIVILWGVWIAFSSRKRAAELVLVSLGVGLVVVSAWNAVGAVTAGNPEPDVSNAVGSLTQKVLAALPGRKGAVVVRSVDSSGSLGYAQALVLELERRGVAARVPPNGAPAFGEHRVVGGGPVRAVLTTATNGDIGRLRAQGSRLLGEVVEGGSPRAGPAIGVFMSPTTG